MLTDVELIVILPLDRATRALVVLGGSIHTDGGMVS
jgi:hypothetical protein